MTYASGVLFGLTPEGEVMEPQAGRALALLFLQGAALLALGWLCLKDLLPLLGLGFQNGTLGGPEDVEPENNPHVPEDLFRQLRALGFTPLGVYWERQRFQKTFLEYAFACPRRRCFAL